MSVPVADWWCPLLGDVTGACGGCTELLLDEKQNVLVENVWL